MAAPPGPGVGEKRAEIYTYEAPWLIYAVNWSVSSPVRPSLHCTDHFFFFFSPLSLSRVSHLFIYYSFFFIIPVSARVQYTDAASATVNARLDEKKLNYNYTRRAVCEPFAVGGGKMLEKKYKTRIHFFDNQSSISSKHGLFFLSF